MASGARLRLAQRGGTSTFHQQVWHPAPCGLHKAYNYLPPEQLALLLQGVERAYVRMRTERE